MYDYKKDLAIIAERLRCLGNYEIERLIRAIDTADMDTVIRCPVCQEPLNWGKDESMTRFPHYWAECTNRKINCTFGFMK